MSAILKGMIELGMPYLFFAVLSILTAIFIWRKTPESDGKFLVLLFAAAMIIRCSFAVLWSQIAYLRGTTGFTSGDDRLYSVTAWDILQNILKGTYKYKIRLFGSNLYTHILALFYGIFGFKLVASKFVNCYLGALIPVAGYNMARFFTGDRFARKTVAAICTFYPSLILWSAHNVKEPLIILTVCLGIYLLLKTIEVRLVAGDLLLFILFSIMTLNLQLIYLYQIGVIVLFLFWFYCSKYARKAMFMLLTAFVIFLLWKGNILLRFITRAEHHQWGVATSDIAGYYIYTKDFMEEICAGRFYFLKFIYIYLKGLAYFLFSPFPFRLQSWSQFLALPQISFWYLIFLFSVIGFIKSIKQRFLQPLAVFIFISIGISIWSLTEGNIGSAFRHRDHFVVIIFIYAAIGFKYSVDSLSGVAKRSKV